MADLVGRKKNKGIQDSPLMQPRQKGPSQKSPPVARVGTYLENAATETSKQNLQLVDFPDGSKRVESPPRVAKTREMIRKHTYYTTEQLERTGRIADVLMQKKALARGQGSPKVKTSERITRSTFVRASIEAVLTKFEDGDIEMVDNEEELVQVILGKMKTT